MEYAQKVILELLNSITQEELGKALNTPQSNISAFANGTRRVSKNAKKNWQNSMVTIWIN